MTMPPRGAMLMLAAASALLADSGLISDGTAHKPAATDYPAHASLASLSIGAEYLVHSFSGKGRTFAAENYLVIEVALYPAAGTSLAVEAGQFSLRINDQKQVALPQAPQFVAASLKYPDWEQRPHGEVEAGAGNAGVILGRPAPVGRFPGDPTDRRLPNPPRAPDPNDRAGIEKEDPVKAEDVAIVSALPEGPATKPVSGYLYFAYKGKMKKIKSLELIYQGPAGKAILFVR